VETTGSSSEFYDKFTIRYHISLILKGMWDSPVHRQAIVNESRFLTCLNILGILFTLCLWTCWLFPWNRAKCIPNKWTGTVYGNHPSWHWHKTECRNYIEFHITDMSRLLKLRSSLKAQFLAVRVCFSSCKISLILGHITVRGYRRWRGQGGARLLMSSCFTSLPVPRLVGPQCVCL
jgi:hypothetical protein